MTRVTIYLSEEMLQVLLTHTVKLVLIFSSTCLFRFIYFSFALKFLLWKSVRNLSTFRPHKCEPSFT